MAGGLEPDDLQGPFQPKPFYDSASGSMQKFLLIDPNFERCRLSCRWKKAYVKSPAMHKNHFCPGYVTLITVVLVLLMWRCHNAELRGPWGSGAVWVPRRLLLGWVGRVCPGPSRGLRPLALLRHPAAHSALVLLTARGCIDLPAFVFSECKKEIN